MDTWRRRTVYYVAGLIVVIAAFTVAYHTGMVLYETPPGETPPSAFHSLQVVIETFTTTGFGSDAPWSSPEMNLLVVVMDLTGVGLIFLALPVLLFPLMEETLSTTAPTEIDDVSDHVVICTYTPRSDTLIDELDSWAVPYVVVEPDRETAADLYGEGYTVVHADPGSVAGLEAANVETARAIVADGADEVDASIVLAAREALDDESEVAVYSVVDEPAHAVYHRLAGADETFSPRRLLGESLASKVTTTVSAGLDGAVEIGDDFELLEVSVDRGSDLVGRSLAESGIRERTGANVIGAWRDGDFETPPDPGAPLTPGTVLLVAGREDQIEALVDVLQATARRHDRGSVVVAGHGEVGSTAARALDAAGAEFTVVDREPMAEVDVVGDATDPAVLREAGIGEARTVLLTLADDTDTEFATLVARDLDPTVEVLARAEDADNVPMMYRAGADYVLALATVSGRMLASAILDEEIMSFDHQVEVVRMPAGALVGRTLGEVDVRSQTGCTVVGVERGNEVLTDLGPGLEFRADDDLVVVGTDRDVNRFTQLL